MQGTFGGFLDAALIDPCNAIGSDAHACVDPI